MTMLTAKIVHKISKAFLAISILGLAAFITVYFNGGVEFKFVSLPVMACVISVTWLVMSKLALVTMTEEADREKTAKKDIA